MTQNKTNLSEFSVAQFKNAGKEKKVWNDQEQAAWLLSRFIISSFITHKDRLNKTSLKNEEKKYN